MLEEAKLLSLRIAAVSERRCGQVGWGKLKASFPPFLETSLPHLCQSIGEA